MTAAWPTGRTTVAELIDRRHLQQITGDAANGDYLIAQAHLRLAGARAAKDADPSGAYALAYDGMRSAVTALLVQQGLRPTSEGGHIAIVEAARAQFGPVFETLNAMRRVRNQLEYPRDADDVEIDVADTDLAIAETEKAIAGVERLLPQLGLWH